jgi:hypothetical protein
LDTSWSLGSPCACCSDTVHPQCPTNFQGFYALLLSPCPPIDPDPIAAPPSRHSHSCGPSTTFWQYALTNPFSLGPCSLQIPNSSQSVVKILIRTGHTLVQTRGSFPPFECAPPSPAHLISASQASPFSASAAGHRFPRVAFLSLECSAPRSMGQLCVDDCPRLPADTLTSGHFAGHGRGEPQHGPQHGLAIRRGRQRPTV